MQSTDVLFEEIEGAKSYFGLITLNRPQALNALSHEMMLAISQQLTQWANKDRIKAVVIKAVPGRAFCAGGDVRSIYQRKQENDPHLERFFLDEYKMNSQIFHYPKPYISLLDGITMGGGAGVSIHGSHRVATENLVFAMPETAIGFFPDVGSSYFLSRLPKNIGIYLGLTGERINYNDCYALGLVDFVIPTASQQELLHALLESSVENKHSISEIIQSFAVTPPQSALLEHEENIMNIFGKNSMEDILHALKNLNSPWALRIIDNLKQQSPTSLKITLQQLTEAKNLNFDACIAMETRIMQGFLHSHDFFEGVRAMLVDKDRAPKWQPRSFEEVGGRF